MGCVALYCSTVGCVALYCSTVDCHCCTVTTVVQWVVFCTDCTSCSGLCCTNGTVVQWVVLHCTVVQWVVLHCTVLVAVGCAAQYCNREVGCFALFRPDITAMVDWV